MKKTVMAFLILVLAACGGGESAGQDSDGGANSTMSGVESEPSDTAGAGSGEVVNPQPDGHAMVSVDGREFTFDTFGPTDCIIEPDKLSFAFIIPDKPETLGAGANLYDDGWLGDILLRVLDENDLPVQYYPDQGAMDGGMTIDGSSMSFSGPMLMQPPNDGSLPPPVSVGDGTISVNCG